MSEKGTRFTTPYSRAWHKFSMTVDFVKAVELSTKPGEDPAYAINRLRFAFDAGWNARFSSTLEALGEVAK